MRIDSSRSRQTQGMIPHARTPPYASQENIRSARYPFEGNHEGSVVRSRCMSVLHGLHRTSRAETGWPEIDPMPVVRELLSVGYQNAGRECLEMRESFAEKACAALALFTGLCCVGLPSSFRSVIPQVGSVLSSCIRCAAEATTEHSASATDCMMRRFTSLISGDPISSRWDRSPHGQERPSAAGGGAK